MKLNSEMSLLKTSDETYLHDQHKKIKQEKKKNPHVVCQQRYQ